MIYLFDDFGNSDIYVGQVKSCLLTEAPGATVIDLTHNAPNFQVEAAAHLLAALSEYLPGDSVVLAVVDPGVGSARRAVACRVDGRWYVGPDNGLLSILVARAASCEVHEIIWRPPVMSASFHGRDLFAPIVAMLERGERWNGALTLRPCLSVMLKSSDLARIIYIDHFGNAMTGLRSASLSARGQIKIAGCLLSFVRVFDEAQDDVPFWYVNSLGLVEIAMKCDNVAALLGLTPGMALEVLL
jgi:S-adenosylmethionine hydrolase